MSAEGKKKRGTSGKSHADASAFRINGGGIFPNHLRTIMHMLPYQYIANIGRPGSIPSPKDGK